jgi:hypothetical protein
MELDIGKNLTGLLERLAGQIGTTADKVFPWYVQQAYLEGLTALVGVALAVTIAASLFFWSFKRANFNDEGNHFAPLCIGSGISLAVSIVAVFIVGIESTRKLINPNYYAMQMLTHDIGRMVGK